MVRFAKKNQLTDEQFRQVLDETEQQFRQEIKGWRLHRFDGNSPLLSQLPNLMDAMAQGVRELMEGYKYAEENRDRLDNLKGMPPTKPKMTGALGWMMRNRNDPSELRHTITRTVPAIALLEKLKECDDIKAYAARTADPADTSKQIAEMMLGSIIRASLEATPHLDIKAGAVSASLC